MTHPLPTRAIARTVVVLGYLIALAVAGKPSWLALLLGREPRARLDRPAAPGSRITAFRGARGGGLRPELP